MMRRLFVLALAFTFSFAAGLTSPQDVHAKEAPAANTYQLFVPLVVNANVIESSPAFPTLEAFAASVGNGEAGVVRGVYVPAKLALPILQQPANDPAYVSSQAEVVTQFGVAANYGVVGLLAHNDLAGSEFFELALNDEVWLVFGDGARQQYQITRLSEYQALQPFSGTSEFVDLQSGEQFTASQVFQEMYTGGDHVTFQTCIAQNGLSNWGRLFVVALPVASDLPTQ